MADGSLSGMWAIVDVLTVKEAAYIAAGFNPEAVKGYGVTAPLIRSLADAVRLGDVSPLEAWTRDDYGDRAPALPGEWIEPDWTTVRASDAAAYFRRRGIGWPFDGTQAPTSNAHCDRSQYPPELRAAIEAFEAVNAAPSAIAGCSVKAALSAWLEANKPELSANARERVATVANWQPNGGAPKTPGG